jgi:hypothetical protein
MPRPHKTRAFYVPIRKSEKSGIRLVVDDLVEVRTRRSALFNKDILRRIENDEQKRKKEVKARTIASRAASRRRQQDLMELAEMSGQLSAQSRLSNRNETRMMGTWVAKEPTADDAAAIAELAKYDEIIWGAAQHRRKSRGGSFQTEGEPET